MFFPTLHDVLCQHIRHSCAKLMRTVYNVLHTILLVCIVGSQFLRSVHTVKTKKLLHIHLLAVFRINASLCSYKSDLGEVGRYLYLAYYYVLGYLTELFWHNHQAVYNFPEHLRIGKRCLRVTLLRSRTPIPARWGWNTPRPAPACGCGHPRPGRCMSTSTAGATAGSASAPSRWKSGGRGSGRSTSPATSTAATTPIPSTPGTPAGRPPTPTPERRA